MSDDKVLAAQPKAPTAGKRMVSEDSPEVARIGALLRGEEVADGKEAEKAGEAPGGDTAGPAVADGGVESPGGDSQDETALDSAPEADGPLSLAELAKSIGAKEGELYDGLQIEVDVAGEDGKHRESVSLGDLRRGYVAAAKLERDREAFDALRDEKSLEFMQTRAELEALGAAIGPHVSREVLDRVEGMITQKMARERALLLEAVPDWKDAAKFTAERAKIVDFLKPWGFTAADVYAIGDHRIARFVRDMARDAGRKAAAERKARERGNGEVKRGQAPEGRVGPPPLRARLANIVKAGKGAKTPQGKTEAVGALLRSIQKR